MKIHILILMLLFGITVCSGMERLNGSENQARWSVIKDESELKIHFGNDTASPQYAVLHLNDSYFRLINSVNSGWGTSVILLPAFWSNGTYFQGAPVTAAWNFSRTDLILSIFGTIGGINVSSEVIIAPPEKNSIRAHVKNTIEGADSLDQRPAETFKPVMLSSMHISPTMWDAQSAFAGGQNYSIPVSEWIIAPSAAVKTNTFGLLGGTSDWKQEAPTIRIDLNNSMQIAGWVKQSDNPNDDNIGYWAASDDILHSYEYTITAISTMMPD